MATHQKPPRILLCLTTARSHIADRYWLGLARLVDHAGYSPLFLLPASDPLSGPAGQEGFRVVESGRGEVKEILRELPTAAALVDSTRAKNGVRAALPWLPKDKIRRVILDGEPQEQGWFFRRLMPALYPSPANVGSGGADDLWLPLQPGRIFVSDDRAKEFRREFDLKDSAPIVWLPGRSRVRTRNWGDCSITCEMLLSGHNDVVLVFGRAIPPGAMEPICDRLHRFGVSRIVYNLSEYEEEKIWSAASAVWLPGFDPEELNESLTRSCEVGVPAFMTDDIVSRQWTAAGFGEEAISKEYPARWVEQTLSNCTDLSWERRRQRMNDFEARWGLTAQATRLFEWLGFPMIRTENEG